MNNEIIFKKEGSREITQSKWIVSLAINDRSKELDLYLKKKKERKEKKGKKEKGKKEREGEEKKRKTIGQQS